VLSKVAASHVPDQQRIDVGSLRGGLRSGVDEDVSHIRTRQQDVTAWWITFDHSDEQGHVLVLPRSTAPPMDAEVPADGTVILWHVDHR
jgi:hypothetical protein